MPIMLFEYIILLRSTKHAVNIQPTIVHGVGDIDTQAEDADLIAFDTAFNTTSSVVLYCPEMYGMILVA